MSPTADEIREQFEAAQRGAQAKKQFWKVLSQGKFGQAAAIAGFLDGPLPRGQVVDLHHARARRAHLPTS